MNVDFLNKYTETVRGEELQSIYGKKISSFRIHSLYQNENTNGLFSRRLIVGKSEIFFYLEIPRAPRTIFFSLSSGYLSCRLQGKTPFMFLFLVMF